MDSSFRRLVKKQVGKTANLFGVTLVTLPKRGNGGSTYGEVRPMATYSPWNGDLSFLKIYEIISDYTLVDIYRCYELWSLLGQTSELEGGILEVGVWRGGTGALLAKRSQISGNTNPIYLCDTFLGVPNAGPRDSTYRGGEHADTSLPIVQELMFQRLKFENVHLLQGIFPEATASQIPESEKFRFCHIDVDVYQSAKDVNEWVWDRLVGGGIVVYDDYGFSGCPGVTSCVNEQVGRPDRVVMHNLNGHAVVIKTADRSARGGRG